MKNNPSKILSLALVLAFLLIGCAGHQQQMTPIPLPADVDPPYMTLIQILDGSEIQTPGRLAQLKNWIVGERQGISLNRPTDVVVDGENRLLVVDSESGAIMVYREFETGWTLTEQLHPEGIKIPLCIEASPDRIFITDQETNAIQVYDYEFNQIADIVYDDMQNPGDMAYAGQTQQLYVTDPQAHAVYIFSEAGEYTGSLGREGYGSALLHYPVCLTIDPESQDIFVLDGIARKVKRYSSQGKLLSSFGEYDRVPGSFAFPKGMTLSSDNVLFISDAAFGNVQLFDPRGALLFFVGKTGSAAGEFLMPRNLYMDNSQRLYVTDPYNNRIQIFQYNPQD